MAKIALFFAGLTLFMHGFMRERGELLSAGLLIMIAAVLSGCCTSTLQPGCDPMPKWKGYVLEYRQ